jgi:YD repeat-containing protein
VRGHAGLGVKVSGSAGTCTPTARRGRTLSRRWSYTFHDAQRRVTARRDPLGRLTTYTWCSCGSLDAVTDGAGNKIAWERDVLGRITKETRSDGRFWAQTYEDSASRLKTITDANGQLKTFGYDVDGRVTAIVYTDEIIATPNVTFNYRDASNAPDPYGRLRRMTDRGGATSYSYQPVGTVGAHRLATIAGPTAGDLAEPDRS